MKTLLQRKKSTALRAAAVMDMAIHSMIAGSSLKIKEFNSC
jgi:hypothetical protein